MAPTSRPPSVDALARSLGGSGLPHPVLVEIARDAIAAGDPESAQAAAEAVQLRLLQPVINATGVLLHTNLGRAPVAHSQAAAFSNVEFDLTTGARGSRHAHAANLIALACGAESALVVNNCAAAVLLVLGALAANKHVVVSRGELVEIGGGFRVPEVMEQSGALLREVGTTNRTRVADYESAASGGDVALLMKIHQSNYRITGFTEEATTAQLAGLGIPLVVDIGSGLLDSRTPWLGSGPPPAWLAGEPAARQNLDDGAALVTFSGDKLFGGAQAGIIAGRSDLVQACAAHPLARALRPGGLVLASLQATALAYLRRDGGAIPFWAMATAAPESLTARAESVVATAGLGQVIDTEAVPGGGTLPGVTIPSIGIRVAGDRTRTLRSRPQPIIARVDDEGTVLDLRTVQPTEDAAVAAALGALG
ncbi:MAG: L-seryl-tRNA(Sec) selenium transferase [Acidimicrobiales bacterium]